VKVFVRMAAQQDADEEIVVTPQTPYEVRRRGTRSGEEVFGNLVSAGEQVFSLAENLTSIIALKSSLASIFFDEPYQKLLHSVEEQKRFIMIEELIASTQTIKSPYKTILENCREEAKLLLGGNISMSLYGEKKVGKSTLCNAILGEEVLLSSTAPCTTVHTTVVSGPSESPDGVVMAELFSDVNVASLLAEKEKEIPDLAGEDYWEKCKRLLLEISDHNGVLFVGKDREAEVIPLVTKLPNVLRRDRIVKQVKIIRPVLGLTQPGVCLEDCPGVLENQHLTQTAQLVARRANVVIYMLDIRTQLKPEDIAFLLRRSDAGSEIMFVFNENEKDTDVDEVMADIRRELGRHEEFRKKEIFRFNVKQNLDFQLEGRPVTLAFKKFLMGVGGALRDRAKGMVFQFSRSFFQLIRAQYLLMSRMISYTVSPNKLTVDQEREQLKKMTEKADSIRAKINKFVEQANAELEEYKQDLGQMYLHFVEEEAPKLRKVAADIAEEERVRKEQGNVGDSPKGSRKEVEQESIGEISASKSNSPVPAASTANNSVFGSFFFGGSNPEVGAGEGESPAEDGDVGVSKSLPSLPPKPEGSSADTVEPRTPLENAEGGGGGNGAATGGVCGEETLSDTSARREKGGSQNGESLEVVRKFSEMINWTPSHVEKRVYDRIGSEFEEAFSNRYVDWLGEKRMKFTKFLLVRAKEIEKETTQWHMTLMGEALNAQIQRLFFRTEKTVTLYGTNYIQPYLGPLSAVMVGSTTAASALGGLLFGVMSAGAVGGLAVAGVAIAGIVASAVGVSQLLKIARRKPTLHEEANTAVDTFVGKMKASQTTEEFQTFASRAVEPCALIRDYFESTLLVNLYDVSAGWLVKHDFLKVQYDELCQIIYLREQLQDIMTLISDTLNAFDEREIVYVRRKLKERTQTNHMQNTCGVCQRAFINCGHLCASCSFGISEISPEAGCPQCNKYKFISQEVGLPVDHSIFDSIQMQEEGDDGANPRGDSPDRAGRGVTSLSSSAGRSRSAFDAVEEARSSGAVITTEHERALLKESLQFYGQAFEKFAKWFNQTHPTASSFDNATLALDSFFYQCIGKFSPLQAMPTTYRTLLVSVLHELTLPLVEDTLVHLYREKYADKDDLVARTYPHIRANKDVQDGKHIALSESERDMMERVGKRYARECGAFLPFDKLRALLDAVTTVSGMRPNLAADDLLPLLTYMFACAEVPHLFSDVQYLSDLLYKNGDPALKCIHMADEYMFVTVSCVVHVLKVEGSLL